MRVTRAADLVVGQKFLTMITAHRGVVQDRAVMTIGVGLVTYAPRVLMVTPTGVLTKTLHPQVLVRTE